MAKCLGLTDIRGPETYIGLFLPFFAAYKAPQLVFGMSVMSPVHDDNETSGMVSRQRSVLEGSKHTVYFRPVGMAEARSGENSTIMLLRRLCQLGILTAEWTREVLIQSDSPCRRKVWFSAPVKECLTRGLKIYHGRMPVCALVSCTWRHATRARAGKTSHSWHEFLGPGDPERKGSQATSSNRP